MLEDTGHVKESGCQVHHYKNERRITRSQTELSGYWTVSSICLLHSDYCGAHSHTEHIICIHHTRNNILKINLRERYMCICFCGWTHSKDQWCRRWKESYRTHALIDRGKRESPCSSAAGVMAASPLRTVSVTGCEDGYTGGRDDNEVHGIVSWLLQSSQKRRKQDCGGSMRTGACGSLRGEKKVWRSVHENGWVAGLWGDLQTALRLWIWNLAHPHGCESATGSLQGQCKKAELYLIRAGARMARIGFQPGAGSARL